MGVEQVASLGPYTLKVMVPVSGAVPPLRCAVS